MRKKTVKPRILIARPDHLGDVLLTVPSVAALRAAIPSAHISFLVTTEMGDVIRHCPEIDQVLTLPFPPLCASPDPAIWSSLVNQTASRLRGCFDLIILSRPEDPWSGELAIKIQRRWGLTPLVPGGPGEEALVEAVVEASDGCAYGLAGRLSVGALAALYRRACLVIGIDSGPVHLAVMVGTPVIGLYGPLDPLKWGPWCLADRHRIVRVQLSCSPCDCIFDPPCGIPIEPPCSTGITVEAVLTAAEEFIGGSGLDAGQSK